jgi:FkbH-like protein
MEASRELIRERKASWRAFQLALRENQQSVGLRIGISATITAEPLIPFLGSALLAKGLRPAIEVAPYGQVFQTCLDWKSAFNTPLGAEAGDPEALDAIVLLWRCEDLMADELTSLATDEAGAIERALAKLDDLAVALATLTASFDGSVVVSLPPYPQSPPVDLQDLIGGAALRRFYLAVALRWQEHCASNTRLLAFDLDQLQRSAGASQIEDLRKWYLYRQPYTEAFWQEAGEVLARILSIGRIPSHKCVVVDCDNTLWGGVVGEDGIEGIALGNDFPGFAFSDFQRQLLALHDRGILIALASKNDEALVWEVFEKHDAMVLKREHIAAWRINWDPKPDNLIALSKELNFALDAFVFIDDSSVEIQEVASRLPEVTCLQVPGDPAKIAELLRGNALFDSIQVTEEDRLRTKMVRSEIERTASGDAMSREKFLQSLELEVRVAQPGPEQLGRVAQLVGKTNQFNLTTIRRSQDEIVALSKSDDHRIYTLFVSDRFGDYGLVGVAIVEQAASEWALDTFLMSCRVLGRGVESAFLDVIFQQASAQGVERIAGSYLPTARNAVVAGFLADHGFEASSEDGNRWVARVGNTPASPDYIRVNPGAKGT